MGERASNVQKKLIRAPIVIMGSIALLVAVITLYVCYDAAVERQRARLVESAQSQARMAEAIHVFTRNDERTRKLLLHAHEESSGSWKSGVELSFGVREGTTIEFLMRRRHGDRRIPPPVEFSAKAAEPMRQALLGNSGTLIGHDYQGTVVLAAYEPIATLNWGIVAKVDMTEIRQSFANVAIVVGVATVFLIVIGAVGIRRVSKRALAG